MDPKVLSTGIPHKHLPENYVRPESDRPRSAEVADCDDMPIIDLDCDDRNLIIEQIRRGCQEYGFFQVVNHGVSKELVEEMMKRVTDEFLESPEEKLKLYYSDDPSKTMSLSTSSNVMKEEVHNWIGSPRLHVWLPKPTSFKEVMRKYCKKILQCGLRLEELISECLGLQRDYSRKVPGDQGQHMAINYYPPCLEPEMTYGLPGHTDPNAFTILLQDLQGSGLLVLKNGKWLSVKPRPGAFVINIGDQLQAQFGTIKPHPAKFRGRADNQAWEPTPLNASPAQLLIPAHASVTIPSHSSQLPIDTHHEDPRKSDNNVEINIYNQMDTHHESPRKSDHKVEINIYNQMGFNSGPGTVGDGGGAGPSFVCSTGGNVNISGIQEAGNVSIGNCGNVFVKFKFA